MIFNYSKLLGKIIEKYGTQCNFALALGLSQRSLSLKLNHKVPWKDIEIYDAVKLLDIDPQKVNEYFFDPKVQIFEPA